jgi:membrane AbrB-like protein
MVMGALISNLLKVDITLPPYLVYPAFAFIGWRVGLGFSREELVRVVKKLPLLLVFIFLLIAAAGLFAWFMVVIGDIDPLTAYLATSPGGLDAVTIIASGTHASLSFVASMQTLRLLLVLIFGPKLAKLCCLLAGLNPS